MKLLMNFPLDKPTINNRTYPREIFERALQEYIKSDGSIVDSPAKTRTIGKIKSYEIKDGIVEADCMVFDSFGKTVFYLAPVGYCDVENKDEEVTVIPENYAIDYFVLARINV